MDLSLEDRVSERLAENHFPLGWTQRYMPCRRLDGLVTRDSIIREFSKDYDSGEHHGSQVRIDEGLINFIVSSGQKLLAISLISGIESSRLHKAMEVFRKWKYTDNELPVSPQDIRFPWSELKWGAIKQENFINNQWKFLVRIFDHNGSNLQVGTQEILPFRLVDTNRREGTFSDVWQVEIHKDQQKHPMRMVRPHRSSTRSRATLTLLNYSSMAVANWLLQRSKRSSYLLIIMDRRRQTFGRKKRRLSKT